MGLLVKRKDHPAILLWPLRRAYGYERGYKETNLLSFALNEKPFEQVFLMGK
jgi:hypothetical protein